MDKYNEYQKRFVKNVHTNLKLKGIKIGDAEKQIGRRAGYICRRKNGSGVIPLKDALALSDIVGESIADLCTKDYDFILFENKIKQYEEEINRLREKYRQMTGEVIE